MMYFDLVSSECSNSTAPHELSIMTATFSSVLLAITVPTNLLVCLAMLIDPNKELRTQFNCFTFNLALADLVVGCVTEPISVYIHIHESRDREYGHQVDPVMQKVLHIPFIISAVASALSIAALALERYLAITAPFRYRLYFNIKLSVVLSIIIWIIALTFGFLNIFLDYVPISFIFVNSVLAFTGLVVGFVCFRIRSTLRRVANSWAEIGMQSTREDNENVQKALTKTFEIMIAALTFCYIPVCGMVYYINLCENCKCNVVQWFRDALFWLILLNSAINPFIYALRNASFRNAVKIIIRCECKQRRPILKQPHRSKPHASKDKRIYKTYQQLPDTSQNESGYGSITTS